MDIGTVVSTVHSEILAEDLWDIIPEEIMEDFPDIIETLEEVFA